MLLLLPGTTLHAYGRLNVLTPYIQLETRSLLWGGVQVSVTCPSRAVAAKVGLGKLCPFDTAGIDKMHIRTNDTTITQITPFGP